MSTSEADARQPLRRGLHPGGAMAPSIETAAATLPRCLELASTLRRWIIEQSLDSRVGHIGSALSIADIMAVLWEGVLRDAGTTAPHRDRFVLGKGHAALALYGVLRWKGLLSEEVFRTYCADNSLLGVHPEHALPGVDLSTGSLGQGLSVACGLALGLRLRNSPGRVHALLSDAECNEGQVWEAAAFAGHHRLDNLTVVVDLNGLQALGHTRDVLNQTRLAQVWASFHWETVEVDGHSCDALLSAYRRPQAGQPRVLIARTVLGKGVSFMEDRLEWHYRNLTPETARAALDELSGAAHNGRGRSG
ncbi:MAG: transketolase [Planctomycetota bacterium]